MGSKPPTVGYGMFYNVNNVNEAKTVTVMVPSTESYDETWQNSFKGSNTNITLVIEAITE
jgi:hypothetical protein